VRLRIITTRETPVDLEEIKELLRIVEERQFSEFELERDGLKLKVRRHSGAGDPAMASSAPALSPGIAGALPEARPAGPAAPSPAPAPAGEEEGLTTVSSPIVGTFYRSPDPNSPPFVNVGDRVSVGQVLCIVEAMKLMNEIEAELVGEIVRIHAENGQPIQYGDPLFTLRVG
jgi:acetyl-CoA carboxylase biotin carboxyl carrier protein